MTQERIFMKVPHSRIETYLDLGWMMRPALTMTHHGYYVVLMEWMCDCPPPYPQRSTLS